MVRLNHFLPESTVEALKDLSAQTDASLAEIVRRALDHALLPPCLDKLFPLMSGQLRVFNCQQ